MRSERSVGRRRCGADRDRSGPRRRPSSLSPHARRRTCCAGSVAGRSQSAVSSRRSPPSPARLPDRARAINLCTDRYRALLGFAAALSRGQITLLSADRAPQRLRALAARYPDAHVIADGPVDTALPVLRPDVAATPAGDASPDGARDPGRADRRHRLHLRLHRRARRAPQALGRAGLRRRGRRRAVRPPRGGRPAGRGRRHRAAAAHVRLRDHPHAAAPFGGRPGGGRDLLPLRRRRSARLRARAPGAGDDALAAPRPARRRHRAAAAAAARRRHLRHRPPLRCPGRSRGTRLEHARCWRSTAPPRPAPWPAAAPWPSPTGCPTAAWRSIPAA